MLPRAALVMVLCALPALTLADGARISVSATVLKRAYLDVQGAPESLVLTPADIARGFVDAPPALSVEIWSNSPAGVLVDFVAESELASAVLGGPLRLSGAQRVHLLRPSYRLLLSPEARPGVYPWPVRVSATPL